MALFQKNPHNNTEKQTLYTLGLNQTVLLVGLGNVGKEYDGTRHNIGFACLDAFVQNQDMPEWMAKKDLKCHISMATIGNTRVIAMKPTTFMNNSGEAVQAVAHFYKVNLDNIIVVHDELDIPFGQIRMRVGGSDAGNNGIKSLINHMGPDFGRVRIGIKAPTPMESVDFVLAKFDDKEQAQMKNLTRETTAILTEYIFGGQLPHETRTFLV